MDGLSMGQSITVACYGAIAAISLYMTWREARSRDFSSLAEVIKTAAGLLLCLIWPVAVAGVSIAILREMSKDTQTVRAAEPLCDALVAGKH